MKTVNEKKFVTLNELADHLNAGKPEPRLQYGIPELACAWADARAKYYQATGKQVEEGIHFIMEGTESLLSHDGCELIEKFATVDGHDMPVMKDGAAALF